MKSLKQKLFIFIVIPVLIASVFSGLIPSGQASAAYRDLSSEQRGRSYGYWRALNHCVTKMAWSIKADAQYDGQRTDPMNGYWFGVDNGGSDPSHGNAVKVVPYKDGKDGGNTGCADAVKTALTKYWNISYPDFLKGIGYKWTQDPVDNTFYWTVDVPSERQNKLKSLLTRNGVNYDYTSAVQYSIYYETFLTSCSASIVNNPSKSIKDYAEPKEGTFVDDFRYRKLQSVGGLTPKEVIYKYDSETNPFPYLYQGNQKSCNQIVEHLQKPSLAQAYIDEVIIDKCKQKGVELSRLGDSRDPLATACLTGAKNPDNDKFCDTEFQSSEEIIACKVGQGVEMSASDAPSNLNTGLNDDDENASSCVIDGVGWLICPVMNFLAGISDVAYTAVSTLLKTPPLLTTGDNDGAYQAWRVMQGFANAAFVIVFLIIIFSQLTSTAISNYGVKRMLPRLIIAALLVNLSFFICAVAVDLSNIIGGSVKPMLDSIGIPAAAPDSITGWDEASTFSSITTFVLAGAVGAVAGGVAIANLGLGALALLVPGIIAVVVAILTVLIVLVIRQALIILLVVISPLAFVAFLLPNTEGLFTKWRKLLLTLLLMYPIIALIFGASSLASIIIMNSAHGNTLLQIAGALVMVVPLAITPIVMKTAGGMLGKIGAVVNNKEKGLFDRANNAAGKFRKNQGDMRRMRAFETDKDGNMLNRSGFMGRKKVQRWNARRSAVNSGRESELNRSSAQYVAATMEENDKFANRAAGGTSFGTDASDGAVSRAKARAAAVTSKLDEEEMKAAAIPIQHQYDRLKASGGNTDAFLKQAALNSSGSSASRHAAANMAAALGRDDVIRDLMASPGADKEMLQSVIGSNASSLIGKAPDLVKGSGPAFSSITGSQLANFSKGTAEAQIKQMQELYSKVESGGPDAAAASADLQKMADAFNSAVVDISNDKSLQSTFSADTGKALASGISSSSAGLQSMLGAAAGIFSDGKIR